MYSSFEDVQPLRHEDKEKSNKFLILFYSYIKRNDFLTFDL